MEEAISENISSIEFNMLSPKLIKKMAVVKIVTPELYDADAFPVESGLMDPKMGVIDPGLRCKTCGGKVKECPGHFGFIKLAQPVIHIEYVSWIYTILRCTCKNCSRVLLDVNKMEEYKSLFKEIEKEKNLREMAKEIKFIQDKIKNVSKCPHCGEKQTKVKLVKPMTFTEESKKLTPIDIRARFEKVLDSDLVFLGVHPAAGRPEWMILTHIPVPPPTTRPSITLENGQRSEDDLTHKLGDIVRTNQRLFENLNAGAPEVIIDDLWELLQYHVTTLFNNNVSQIPPARHRSGRPLKTLSDRIKSKEGRFRRNLAGKRVNFCARTVISPDPFLEIDEVGVPIDIAKDVTIPENVTSWNASWLKTLIKNGAANYPGANYVITLDGKRKRITDETVSAIIEELTEGYIVERHLINGDLVIFNRQPSLHKISIMAHRARVLPYKTFRLNLCVTEPYHADFDGDEMNLHVPQTVEARAEAETLLKVERNILTPRYGLPIIGCVKDEITGMYLLTREGTVLPRKSAMQILYNCGVKESFKENKVLGKDIFSKILPKGLNYEGTSNTCLKCDKCKKAECEHNSYITIKDGVLKTGAIEKTAVGAGKAKLIQKIMNDFGFEAAKDFLNKCSLLAISYLDKVGSTVSFADTDTEKRVLDKIDENLVLADERVVNLIKSYDKREMEILPGRTRRETLELRIINVLNRARDQCGELIQKNANPRIGSILYLNAGSTGSMLNYTLTTACVGQQSLRGERVDMGYVNRTLPHFKRGDLSPRAHGFIKSSYKKGLDPFEFFFHAMTGRDSLMDTSTRTPKSGYLQRRLINAMQDLRVVEDLSVRDGFNRIIQFKYGEDGIDVSKSNNGSLNLAGIEG